MGRVLPHHVLISNIGSHINNNLGEGKSVEKFLIDYYLFDYWYTYVCWFNVKSLTYLSEKNYEFLVYNDVLAETTDYNCYVEVGL